MLDSNNNESTNKFIISRDDTVWTGGTELFRVQENGCVGIGTTNPGEKLVVQGNVLVNPGSSSGRQFIGNNNGAGNPGIILGQGGSYTEDTMPTIKKVNDTNNLAIMLSGNVGIGTTTPGTYKLYVNGSLAVNSGTAEKTGGGSWGTLSDGRLKDMHGNYVKGLNEIAEIEPVIFSYKKDNPVTDDTDKNYVGVIAQELQTVFPEAVSENADGFLRMETDPVLWALVNAVKELKAENEILKSEIESLKLR